MSIANKSAKRELAKAEKRIAERHIATDVKDENTIQNKIFNELVDTYERFGEKVNVFDELAEAIKTMEEEYDVELTDEQRRYLYKTYGVVPEWVNNVPEDHWAKQFVNQWMR